MQVWCIDSKIQLLYSLVYLKMVHKDLHDTMFELISLCGLTAVSITIGSSVMSPHDWDKLSSPWSCGRIMSSSSSDSMHWVGVDVSSGSEIRSHWTPTSLMELLMLTLTPNVHKKEKLNLHSIAHHACYALTLTACCWQNSSLYTLWCCLRIGLAGNWIAALLPSNICILSSAQFVTPN